MTHIGPTPPEDGQDYEPRCARCGRDVDREHCDHCEDGYSDHECGEDTCCCLRPELNVPCEICEGKGGWWRCMQSGDWCEAHPLPGRDHIRRGEVEWVVTERM